MTFLWDDDTLAKTRKLFNDGFTASQIAESIGAPSRNSVCGKLARMKLTRGKAVRHAKPEPVAPPEVRKQSKNIGPQVQAINRRSSVPVGSLAFKVIRSIRAAKHPTDAPDAPLYVVHDAADVQPRLLSLIDLEPGDCRWPYGDGPYVFCGCQKISAGPYCYAHDLQSKPPAEQRKARAA